MQTVRNMLRINKHKLDEELELQAYVGDQISQQLNRALAQLESANTELKKTDARLYGDYRAGAEKATETEIKMLTLRHADHVSAQGRQAAAQHVANEWASLKADWTARGYDLTNFAKLYSSSYFEATRTTAHGNDTGYTRGREAMHEQRQTVGRVRAPAPQEETPPTTRVRMRAP